MYFFKVHDAKDLVDKEGALLAGTNESRAVALQLAGRSITDIVPGLWKHEGDWVYTIPVEFGARLEAMCSSIRPVALCGSQP